MKNRVENGHSQIAIVAVIKLFSLNIIIRNSICFRMWSTAYVDNSLLIFLYFKVPNKMFKIFFNM